MTRLTPTEVADMFGPIAAREYENSTDWSLDELSDWLRKLPSLTADELHHVAMSAIFGSSFWVNRRGNHENEHCKASAVWAYCDTLDKAEHQEECPAIGNRYVRAYNQTVRESGHSRLATPLGKCNCQQPQDGT